MDYDSDEEIAAKQRELEELLAKKKRRKRKLVVSFELSIKSIQSFRKPTWNQATQMIPLLFGTKRH
jgi:hypothetical protein